MKRTIILVAVVAVLATCAMSQQVNNEEEEMWLKAALRGASIAGRIADKLHREDEEDLDYYSNGYRMNNRGYLANPSRSAQIAARNAGALTNREARSMGLRNHREMEEDLGWLGNMEAQNRVGPAFNRMRGGNSAFSSSLDREEDMDYMSGGIRYNNYGYKANPTRSAQIAARNAGALTNREARSMGLRNHREMEEDLGWLDALETQNKVLGPAFDRMRDNSAFSSFDREEDMDYMSGGRRYNNRGYIANPSRSAQIAARNAGALTNREARSMGLRNHREMEEDLGWLGALEAQNRVLRPAFDRMRDNSAFSSFDREEDMDYMSGGIRYNNYGYKANPTRSAQIAARNAGALTNREARSMGLRNHREEDLDYYSNGYRMNNRGYLANPSRSAQIAARNAGALTNREARSMGLRNRREM